MRLLLSALLTSLAAMPSGQDVPGEIEGFKLYLLPESSASCYENRLMVDPTSRRVVTWTSPRDLRDFDSVMPHSFQIMNLPDDGTATPVIVIGTNARVEPLRWSESGDRLLFRVDARGTGFYLADQQRVEVGPRMDPLWEEVKIEAVANGDLAFHQRPEALALLRRVRADGEPRRVLLAQGATSAALLAFHWRNQFRLTAYAGTRRWETGKNIAFTSAPLLMPGTARVRQLGEQEAGRPFLPYALPFLDRRLGAIAGRFGITRIEPLRGRAIDLGKHFGQLTAIADVAANGTTLFALVDLERERRVARIRDGKISSWLLCEKKPLPIPIKLPPDDSLPADTPVVRSEVPLGTGMGHAFATLYRPVHADGRLIVYFHGGPTIPFSLDAVPWGVREAAASGISILVVEYSGMQGGGAALSERLPRLGIAAYRQDVDRVMRWVARSPFQRRYLLVDSFGGIPGVLTARYHAALFDHMFFRAPALTLHSPEETLRDREGFARDRVSPESQREFEAAIYGGDAGRARFVADLRAEVSQLRPSSRLSFYFGTKDGASQPGDLPAQFHGRPEVMIVQSTHGMLANLEEVERDIAMKMAWPGRQEQLKAP